MSNKNKLLEFFKQGFDTNTRFTDSFIHSFALQLNYLNKDIDDTVLDEWIEVISDIQEIMNPKFTDDIKFFNSLNSYIYRLKGDKK